MAVYKFKRAEIVETTNVDQNGKTDGDTKVRLYFDEHCTSQFDCIESWLELSLQDMNRIHTLLVVGSK